MSKLSDIIQSTRRPSLFIGNGINRHRENVSASWDNLLNELQMDQGLSLTEAQRAEMSNTELFDILDLAKPAEDRRSLQRSFCDLMDSWKPAEHHHTIVNWARRHNRPIITVNFDENLSQAIGGNLFHMSESFTDYYPWSSYFGIKEISNPRSNFAIWHAHGMMRYSRSIRLGLTHYMGSVQRARSWVYGRKGLRSSASNGDERWLGSMTWLEVLFFSPLMIFGFGFGKDENFMRWLFLERARLHKLRPEWKVDTWFVVRESEASEDRRLFFEKLGIDFVMVTDHAEIYEEEAWRH